MANHASKTISKIKKVLLFILVYQMTSCSVQMKEKAIDDNTEIEIKNPSDNLNQSTTFPQIHSNLNGMVTEFVRTMYQDKKGNYWFGTNTDGIIRYNGQKLEKVTVEQIRKWFSVRKIVEDNVGNIWFGTSSGLIKYDGEKFTVFSTEAGLQNEEIWGLAIDRAGLIWVGSIGGVSHFDGKKFIPFMLPETKVEDPKPMLSDKLVLKFVEDKNGTMWLVTDGNGILKYKNGEFTHLTNKNGLTDNNAADILEDKKGNIWIGTFYGGVSKFDGKTYTNFTKDGIIKGEETYNFCEDSRGNIWFTAEGYGVYRYDGNAFTQFTTENGLTSNVTLSILADNKEQVWFGSWQGLSIYDGQKIMDSKLKEPWTK